jgi:maltose alpha-D-glucosyltransferase/alpha-amylase
MEQSNTGVFFGTRLYLKAYRRLQYGINPEVEIGHFLAGAEFPHVAKVAGSIAWIAPDGTSAALALLQEYVDNRGNVWDYTLDHLTRRFAPGVWPGTAEETDTDGMNHVYLLQLETLGKRVGEMHAAFARTTPDPAFAPEAVDAAEVGAWREGMLDDVRHTLAQLDGRRAQLDAEGAALAARVLAAGEALILRVQRLALDHRGLVKTRHHGDLHLGQVLLAGDDFVIIDFEGEPARALAERRSKHSPLRDAAGIVRSLDYAARTILRRCREAQPEHLEAIAAALLQWRTIATAAFVRGYRGATAAVASVPAQAAVLEDFLSLFVLEKMLYELRYELDNRPDWAAIPLAALAELAEQAPPEDSGPASGG